jgi:hypothetical protein
MPTANVPDIDYGNAGTPTINPSIGVYYGAASVVTRRYWSFTATTADPPNIEVGDTVYFDYDGGGSYSGVCTYIALVGSTITYLGLMEYGAPYDTCTISDQIPPKLAVILVQGSNIFYLMEGEDYAITTVGTTSGGGYIKISLSTLTIADHDGMTALNYKTDRVYYRFTDDYSGSSLQHSAMARTMLLRAGVSADVSSYQTAYGTLDAKVAINIPELGQKTYKDYSYYISKILQSTFAYLYQDVSDGNVKYAFFDAPTSANLILEEEMIGLRVEFDGKEMAYEKTISNDVTFYYYTSNDITASGSEEFEDRSGWVTTPTIISSTKSQYIHSLAKTKAEDSVLIDTSVKSANKTAFMENIQTVITFSTATKHANLNIGDSVALANDNIPGNKTSYSGYDCTLARVIGIDYGTDKITFTCIDFKGL